MKKDRFYHDYAMHYYGTCQKDGKLDVACFQEKIWKMLEEHAEEKLKDKITLHNFFKLLKEKILDLYSQYNKETTTEYYVKK